MITFSMSLVEKKLNGLDCLLHGFCKKKQKWGVGKTKKNDVSISHHVHIYNKKLIKRPTFNHNVSLTSFCDCNEALHSEKTLNTQQALKWDPFLLVWSTSTPWRPLGGHTASQRGQAVQTARGSESPGPIFLERSERRQDWRRWSTAWTHLRWCSTEDAACQTRPERRREGEALWVLLSLREN